MYKIPLLSRISQSVVWFYHNTGGERCEVLPHSNDNSSKSRHQATSHLPSPQTHSTQKKGQKNGKKRGQKNGGRLDLRLNNQKKFRLPRYFVKDQALHIIQRSNNREPIFAHDEDHHFYLKCLQDAVKRNKLSIHAYILIGNHACVFTCSVVDVMYSTSIIHIAVPARYERGVTKPR